MVFGAVSHNGLVCFTRATGKDVPHLTHWGLIESTTALHYRDIIQKKVFSPFDRDGIRDSTSVWQQDFEELRLKSYRESVGVNKDYTRRKNRCNGGRTGNLALRSLESSVHS